MPDQLSPAMIDVLRQIAQIDREMDDIHSDTLMALSRRGLIYGPALYQSYLTSTGRKVLREALDAINRAEPEDRKRLLDALSKPQRFRIVEGDTDAR